MSHHEILLERHDAVVTVTLNRPQSRNALTASLIETLTRTFAEAGSDGSRALVLRGAGDAFCSGLDLAELRKLAALTAEEQRADSARIAAMLLALYRCPLPTIAVVRGAAVAGGMGMATLCDFTLAAEGATFGYPEARIGFIPAIVAAFLREQVGEKIARELLLTARQIDAAEAAALGLVTRVLPAGELEDAVEKLLAELKKNSPQSLRATKALLIEQQWPSLQHSLQAAEQANAAMRATADFHEGLSAFLEKRKPAWTL